MIVKCFIVKLNISLPFCGVCVCVCECVECSVYSVNTVHMIKMGRYTACEQPFSAVFVSRSQLDAVSNIHVTSFLGL